MSLTSIAEAFRQSAADAKKFEASMRKLSAAVDASMRSMMFPGLTGEAREALDALSQEERDQVIAATLRIRKSLPPKVLKHRGLAPVNCRCTNIYVTVA